MPPAPIVDPDQIDTSRVLYGRQAIEDFNPQRFEMELLDAVVRLDEAEHLIIGYSDIREDAFWVRGHMPHFPLLPGVLICELAAQACAFYCKHIKLLSEGFVGFGGMEDVRFRGPVKPGDRLVVVCKGMRMHRRQSIFDTQGFVAGNMVYHGKIIGVPLNPEITP
jgi:3-hydroxyacyl-[acyl-carrier-protein] dehydratase